MPARRIRLFRSTLVVGLAWLLTLSMPFAAAATAPADGRISLAELLKDPPLDQLFHTAWGTREGLDGVVTGLAQTTDGYLWVGTEQGLYRFDGIRFERFETLAGEALPSEAVLTLYATPDNGLWVGFLRGGFSFVRDGHVLQTERVQPGGLEGSTRAFAREKDGTMWVVCTRGLFRQEAGRWRRMGKADGFAEGVAGLVTLNVLPDADGNLWVNTSGGLLVRPVRHERFEAVETPWHVPGQEGVPSYLAVAVHGRAWASIATGPGAGRYRYVRLPRPDVAGEVFGTGYPVPASLYMPMFAADGTLWYGAADGLTRERLPRREVDAGAALPASAIAPPPVPLIPLAPAPTPPASGTRQAFDFSVPALQRLTRAQGLSGDHVQTIFQDREGTLWIGTDAGLDRLRPTKVSLVRLPASMSDLSMAAGTRGDVWFTSRGGILRLDPTGQPHDLDRIPTASSSMSHVFVDHAGVVWVGDRQGVSRIAPDGRVVNESLQAFPDWSGSVRDMAEDASGTLWVAGQFMGLLRRFGDGHWERLSGNKGFPKSFNVSCLATDGQGRVWLAYDDGLVRVDGGDKLTRFTAADGLRVGGVLSITAHRGHLWIGGERGVQRLDDGGFHDVRASVAETLKGVSGIVETPQGDLWLNGAAGITRIGSDDLRRVMAEPAYAAPVSPLNTLDGLPGRAQTVWPLRTALETPDGRLWFSTTNGLVTLDPAALARPDAPTKIDIQRVATNGVPLPTRKGDAIRAAAGTTDLQIDYTAMTLAMPERVSFRYRLRGLETAWHDAGARRQAFYTNLGAGRYVFEVQAANAGGVRSDASATTEIEIPPTFVQSDGFKILCVLTALALVAFFVQLRLRQLEARALAQYRVRLEERTRIAQDLHDTLLQGFQGLLLRFQRVARAIHEPQARQEMERVLDQADEVVIDGRNRVADLHRPPPDAIPLEQALEALGRDLSGFHDSGFRLHLEGTPRALEPTVHTEVALVAREALFNAFQHSKAVRIELTIRYADAALVLRLADDGVGLPAKVLAEGQCAGHWGLSGMRERMHRVGGSFELRSTQGAGTDIELGIPAARAYRQADEPASFPGLRSRAQNLLLRVRARRAPE